MLLRYSLGLDVEACAVEAAARSAIAAGVVTQDVTSRADRAVSTRAVTEWIVSCLTSEVPAPTQCSDGALSEPPVRRYSANSSGRVLARIPRAASSTS